MNPVSNLPADQFNKAAGNVRKQQQTTATQNAQGQMAGNVVPSAVKPDNTIQMPKRNRKPKGKAAESTQFYKLNYIFESILAEQDPESVATKQTISQYITTFFKQFMTGIEIKDPTVKTQIASLAKELEQNYAKDKGRTTLPKLANLAYSVSYANSKTNDKTDDKTEKPTSDAEKSTSDTAKNTSVATTTASTTTPATPTTQDAKASAQLVKMKAGDIMRLIEPLPGQQQRSILQTLSRKYEKLVASNNDPVDAEIIARAKNLSKPKSAKKTAPKAAPAGNTGGTYNKKTGAAKLGGKTMVSADDLPPNIQKQLQQK
jgi:hypothetical protein